ncbi:acid type B receptor subunit 2 [Seminavis robusta]|uniref:Acid type B receptor subunit 2 n=1 Tax=Seminavis robusta TaxID=568900 RepID=A0A9N8DWI5_9STRA|nr:acid type B receptor subunit 2 [Seminavis robusta]|eukprot:Sro417_g138800.1 acid type B receptor subunit 2 (1149) ;mRNA; r:57995-61982
MHSLVIFQLLSSALLLAPKWVAAVRVDHQDFPPEIHLRGGVVLSRKFAEVKEVRDSYGTTKETYHGFQLDLLESLKAFAVQDGVNLTVGLSRVPSEYDGALNLIANDCNSSVIADLREGGDKYYQDHDCTSLDLLIGDYWVTPERFERIDYTPNWLRTAVTTMKYIDGPFSGITTMTQATRKRAPVCVPAKTYTMRVAYEKFPDAEYVECSWDNLFEECERFLLEGRCALFVNDLLVLKTRQFHEPQKFEVTGEEFNSQQTAWPLRHDLPEVVSYLLRRWIYQAQTNGTLDALYYEYFERQICPIGTAGEDCDLPCDPEHGVDVKGVCVCESIKWTGDDCSFEVPENHNMIPDALRSVAYAMFGINVAVILLCAVWLYWQKDSAQVSSSQPSFLLLVLLGCIISSSTIIALAQEDDPSTTEAEDVPCMAIPWLYSVGFSITFGTLFAKIRRVYLIFLNAGAVVRTGQSTYTQPRRNSTVSWQETVMIIAAVLLVDVTILVIWTVVDPLQWQRSITQADQFGVVLESEGYCHCESLVAFASLIGVFHLSLMGTACYMSYCARNIPTMFQEGKTVSIAMVSNLQIFIVGVPVLIIVGYDPQSSFFVRSVIIWMNDLAVVVLIFGNLVFATHVQKQDETHIKEGVGRAVSLYSRAGKQATSSAGSPPSNGSAQHKSSVMKSAEGDLEAYLQQHKEQMQMPQPRGDLVSSLTMTSSASAEVETPQDGYASSVTMGSSKGRKGVPFGLASCVEVDEEAEEEEETWVEDLSPQRRHSFDSAARFSTASGATPPRLPVRSGLPLRRSNSDDSLARFSTTSMGREHPVEPLPMRWLNRESFGVLPVPPVLPTEQGIPAARRLSYESMSRFSTDSAHTPPKAPLRDFSISSVGIDDGDESFCAQLASEQQKADTVLRQPMTPNPIRQSLRSEESPRIPARMLSDVESTEDNLNHEPPLPVSASRRTSINSAPCMPLRVHSDAESTAGKVDEVFAIVHHNASETYQYPGERANGTRASMGSTAGNHSGDEGEGNNTLNIFGSPRMPTRVMSVAESTASGSSDEKEGGAGQLAALKAPNLPRRLPSVGRDNDSVDRQQKPNARAWKTTNCSPSLPRLPPRQELDASLSQADRSKGSASTTKEGTSRTQLDASDYSDEQL